MEAGVSGLLWAPRAWLDGDWADQVLLRVGADGRWAQVAAGVAEPPAGASVLAVHGHAVLFDGHSIKSELPWLFEGRLADLNLGSAGGASCAPSLRAALAGVLAAQARLSHVVDGRFKGGHITRHYGRPREGVHAVQLEMAWRCYCADEARPE
ncbi:MAG: N-formylglutamate amidohydrolase, partial [Betaproteobacteria bacterium]